MNLWQLSDMADKLVAEKKAQLSGEKVILDLKELGYTKVLGGGSVSRAIQVNVECSESAAKKLKDAGGDVVNANVTK